MTTPDTTTELYYDPSTGQHTHVAGAHLIDAGTRPMGHLEAAAFMTMWHHRTVDGQVPTEFFPFVEGEDGDITGPGHQDPATFAALVSAYDAAENTGVMAHDPTAPAPTGAPSGPSSATTPPCPPGSSSSTASPTRWRTPTTG